MKIYTKTGDTGTTALVGGTRVPKHHIRIECYGTIDELSAWVGLIRDQDIGNKLKSDLIEVQDRLFTIESILASENPEELKLPVIHEGDVKFLENEIDNMSSDLSPLRSFLLSGGDSVVSYCHIARTVCRRGERLVLKLSEEAKVDPLVLSYLNRLSDYLFVLSRKIAKERNVEETLWKPRV